MIHVAKAVAVALRYSQHPKEPSGGESKTIVFPDETHKGASSRRVPLTAGRSTDLLVLVIEREGVSTSMALGSFSRNTRKEWRSVSPRLTMYRRWHISNQHVTMWPATPDEIVPHIATKTITDVLRGRALLTKLIMDNCTCLLQYLGCGIPSSSLCWCRVRSYCSSRPL